MFEVSLRHPSGSKNRGFEGGERFSLVKRMSGSW